MYELSGTQFEHVRALMQAYAGIDMGRDKKQFASARLMALAGEHELGDPEMLLRQLRSASSDGLRQRVAEALLNNETSFFRDFCCFETLRRHVIPEIMEAKAQSRDLKIWSAGCASGQEAYSAAMLLHEHFPELVRPARIMGSDVSHSVIDRARAGLFSQLEVNRGLPARLLLKYFVQHGTSWRLRPVIRGSVEFQVRNLAGRWPPIGQVDILLMRNVLIYMRSEVRREVLRRVRGVIAPRGILLIGAAERPLCPEDGFIARSWGSCTCYSRLG
jgi:chemotaxis protein methyltransferase CheR